MDFDHVVGIFQSTLSVRRAAVSDPALQRAGEISIHALREESGVDGFVAVGVGHDISIHALREESGTPRKAPRSRARKFQSTLSVRRAARGAVGFHQTHGFQSTLSVRRAAGRLCCGR